MNKLQIQNIVNYSFIKFFSLKVLISYLYLTEITLYSIIFFIELSVISVKYNYEIKTFHENNFIKE